MFKVTKLEVTLAWDSESDSLAPWGGSGLIQQTLTDCLGKDAALAREERRMSEPTSSRS